MNFIWDRFNFYWRRVQPALCLQQLGSFSDSLHNTCCHPPSLPRQVSGSNAFWLLWPSPPWNLLLGSRILQMWPPPLSRPPSRGGRCAFSAVQTRVCGDLNRWHCNFWLLSTECCRENPKKLGYDNHEWKIKVQFDGLAHIPWLWDLSRDDEALFTSWQMCMSKCTAIRTFFRKKTWIVRITVHLDVYIWRPTSRVWWRRYDTF